MLPNFDINSNYYITIAEGGWSPCIEGNNAYNLRPVPGSVLPNCVGFTVGRFNEVLQLNDCIWLGSVNANQMLNLAMSQGLPTGDIAIEGGVICWDNGIDGHCSFIESVIDRHTVIINESGWNYTSGPIVRGGVVNKVNGEWQRAGYTYQGIFYLPGTIVKDYQDTNYYMMWLQKEGKRRWM